MPDESKQTLLRKQYLTNVPRRYVYGGLLGFALLTIALYLCVPHYRSLTVANSAQMNDAHRSIINSYFVKATTCRNDNLSHADRVKSFNNYFDVNRFANRAVIRGCNEQDTLLAKDDSGNWQKTDVNIVLSSRQNPTWQKACLIDDITKTDSKIRPENASIDANNLAICNNLAKQSYIELHDGIHLHFN